MQRDRQPGTAAVLSVLAVPAVLLVLAVVSVLPGAARATTVDALCAPAADPCVVDTTIAVQNMSVLDLGGRALRVAGSGRLQAGSGMMTIIAGAVTVEAGGVISARGSGSTAGGFVDLRAASLAVAGTIDVSGAPPGQLIATVAGAATISGLLDGHSLARAESGGVITVEAATISMSGTVDARSGTEDSLGGDVELLAANDVNVAGTITVIGPDGGTITIDAGSSLSAGNVTLTNASNLLADGAFQGGFGGSIDITAVGDGVATGGVQASGSMSVNGASAGIEIGGGSGGCLSINATGAIVLDNASATLAVRGGGPDGDGGELEIISDRSGVVVLSRLDVSANRNIPEEAGGGGAISIDSVGGIALLGQIVAFGGDGGEVAALSSRAGVSVGAGVTVDVTGAGFGSGGAICLESATVPSAAPAAVVVDGTLNADGGGAAGEGGAVELIGRDSTRVAGLLTLDGGTGGGLGGAAFVTAVAGPALVDGTVRARGRGGAGGSVAIDGASVEIAASATVDVSGAGAASGDTDIGVSTSAGPVVVAGTLLATGAPGSGGLVEILAGGDVTILGTLSADGAAQPGGSVRVFGCDVRVCGFGAEGCGDRVGVIRTQGPNGLNRLTARDRADVFGTMTASLSGRNELVVRPPASENFFVLGTVSPVPNPIGDETLLPCLCGALCIAEEIFNGDSIGRPEADWNGDGRVSAADFVAWARSLAES